MAWHTNVLRQLQASGIFSNVQLVGGKVRAKVNETCFLDLHFDPISHSYSYALIDLSLPYPGDKRIFGWDDFPHINSPELKRLSSYPHHFQERTPGGQWQFTESAFRGKIETEVKAVLKYIQFYLAEHNKSE